MAFKDLFTRKSTDAPSIDERINRIQQEKSMQGIIRDKQSTLPMTQGAFQMPVKKIIDSDRVREATRILNEYKKSKANLDAKIIDNEQWYKLRHWDQMRKSKNEGKEDEVEPVSAWLFNVLANKHADAMDNFPSPNVLPREEGDKNEAKVLSSILPVILDQNGFKKTYSKVMHHKIRSGTGAYGIYWDATKHNGIGDIAINRVDVLNLYWEPGITDIQESKNLFHTTLVDNDILEQSYPQLKGQLKTSSIDVKKYLYDDTVDNNNKSVVVDWYYKIFDGTKSILHYCKYVNDTVLYATENETQPFTDELGNIIKPPMSEVGLYEHGKYPFVFDVLFTMEGTPAGFGYIDVGMHPQEYIDRGDQAIMENMLANAKPRFFGKEGAGINVDEFMDLRNPIVHVQGSLEGAVSPIPHTPFPSIYLEVKNSKIDELKETTGNRDVATGGTSGGVTAASAIAAQMEASSKLSRNSNGESYEAFKEVCLIVIELIRQFYDIPRFFRVMGDGGVESFVEYSNSKLVPQAQGDEMGVQTGTRLPLFDIEVTAQKQSPYTKMAQNELALQFYQLGFFNPQMADQALACLEMMDFDRKSEVMNRIAQNGAMFQQILMLQAQLSALQGQAQGVAPNGNGNVNVEQTEALGGKEGGKESSVTKKARERVAGLTDPT